MAKGMNVVAHNLMGAFSNRQLGITEKSRNKSLEKLASGYRINRSGDDASGLAISEKMRRQIRGLEKGSENILEGIDLIKTAEGSLNEVHDMLQRMNELTVKGLTDSLNHDDRQYIQNEIDQLYEEIVRVANNTTYNEIYVLKGNPLVTHELEEVQHEIQKVDVTKVADSMPPEYVSFTRGSMTLGGAAGATQKSSGDYGYKTIDSAGNLLVGAAALSVTDKQDIKYDSWNTDLTENYGSKLDFSALASVSGKTTNTDGSEGGSKFYEALNKFVGTGFYSTCCTCNQQYTVVFIDDNGDYTFQDDNGYNPDGTYNNKYGGTVYVNLTDLLEKAKDADTVADSQNLTKEFLALIESSAGNNSKIKSHFSRFSTSSSDPYSLFVYDYRDYTADTTDERYGFVIPPDSSRGTGQVGNVTGKLIVKNTEVVLDITTYQSHDPINIQHGDDAQNNSKINLPMLEGIFDVYKKYGYESVKKSLTLEEYFPESTVYAPGTYTSKTVTVPAYSYQTPIIQRGETHTETWYEYGEEKTRTWKDPDVITGYQTVDVPESIKTIYEYHQGDATSVPPHYGPLNDPMLCVIKDLIAQVSDIRVQFGAAQNRLEHAYKYNLLSIENQSDAESEIRDTDMAKEMVSLSNSNILAQAGQSMLAQANSMPESLLRLLQ